MLNKMNFENIFLKRYNAYFFFFGIGFIVYFNSLFGAFLWDDTIQIVNNHLVHSFFNLPLFFSNNNILTGSFYRPLQISFLSFLYTFFGQSTFFFHLSQVTIHIMNAILIFKLFSQVINKKLSYFLALIFLVHPIQVESVSYISALSEPLCTFFGLLALLIATKKSSKPSIIFSIYGLLFLSILSKETGFFFIFLVLTYQLLNRTQRFVWHALTTLALVILYLFMRFQIAHIKYTKLSFIPIQDASLQDRLATMPQIAFYYIKTFIFPKNLFISQQWLIDSITFHNFYFPLILIIILVFLTIRIGLWIKTYRKNYFLSFIFFGLWFLLGISMFLQIIPLTMTVADRWFYTPMIGLLGMLGIILQQVRLQSNLAKNICLIFAVFIIIGLSLRTVVRNNDWHDALTLYHHDVRYMKNFFLESDLGVEYLSRGQYDKARIHFKNSVEILPYEVNLFNLGLTYAKAGDTKTAKIYFKEAVGHYKGYLDHTSFARLLFIYNDPEDAKTLIQNGLVVKPNDLELLMFLGLAEYKLDNKQMALEIAQKVYSLYPSPQTQYILYQITNNLPLELK